VVFCGEEFDGEIIEMGAENNEHSIVVKAKILVGVDAWNTKIEEL